MNTSLGVSFLRTVNEEGSNGWAQVYARVPFDDYELSEKGALFGVVLGKSEENWTEKEGEVMEWVDEYFNKTEKGGEISVFTENFREKYADLEGAWMWVVPSAEGKRELKMIRWGRAGVNLMRGNRKYELTQEENKVVRGMANEKDMVELWSGALGEMLEEDQKNKADDEERVMKYGNKLAEAREAGAGLFFIFEKEQKTDIKNSEPMVMEKTEEKSSEEPEKREEFQEDLAGEAIVGRTGSKEKVANWLRRSRTSGEIRVETDKIAKRKKWAVFLGIMFLIVLVISLVSGSIKIKADREAKKWREFSEPITRSIQEAQGLVSINPSGAKKLMEDVKTTFAVQKAEFANTKYKDEVTKLEEQINNAWVVTSGEKQRQFEEVANIQLVRSGFVGERLSWVKEKKFMAMDSSLGIVTSVTTTNKNISVVAGKGEGMGWIDAISDGTKVLILSSKGVSVDDKNVGGIVFDMAVSKPVALGRFGSNVYVLDGGNKEIYKYGAISDGYGDRTRWLKQDQSISVNPVDMAMDTDVWVLGDDGKVEKYRRGAKEQFLLNGMPEGTKATRIALQQEGDSLAVLDKTAGTVIVCSKETGSCSQQLKSDKLKSAGDIEYDDEGNLLVLVGGVIGLLK